MVLKYSQTIDFSQKCPAVSLYDPRREQYVALHHLYQPQGLLVFTWCNHCPYVMRIEDKINELARIYQDQIGFVGINLNDPERYPQDGPLAMKDRAEEKQYAFHYLFDEHAILMNYLPVVCTPEFMLFDRFNCWYHGACDDTTGTQAPTGNHIMNAIKGMLGQALYQGQHAMGCSIKR
jgi:thiol-disulfide isomerase/thioredoxin